MSPVAQGRGGRPRCDVRPRHVRPDRWRPGRDQGGAPVPERGVRVGGSLFWDVLGIHREVLTGIGQVARTGDPARHRDRLVGRRLRAARPGRRAAGQPLQPPRHPREVIAEQVDAQIDAHALRHHRPPAAPVQHGLPARRGPRHRGARLRGLAAAPARPSRLLAHRGGGRRAHQRLDHPALRRTTGEWSVDLAARLGLPWSILPPLRDPGSLIGPVLPRSQPTWASLPTSRSSRSARTTPPPPSSPCRPPAATSATSRPAPGRWSGWSSTHPC